jgi:hypothetical protein
MAAATRNVATPTQPKRLWSAADTLRLLGLLAQWHLLPGIQGAVIVSPVAYRLEVVPKSKHRTNSIHERHLSRADVPLD